LTLKLGENGANELKRAAYARVETLRMDLEEESWFDSKHEETQELLKKFDDMAESLHLGFVDRPHHWWDKIDELVRAMAVWTCLVLFAITLAIPCILIRPIEDIFIMLHILHSRWALSNLAKYVVANVIIFVSGIKLELSGLTADTFTEDLPVVLCFSHSSTMDAFILSACVPVRFFALAKWDLFLIPFFSWLLIAFGGMPVNRNDRKQSIDSLKKATANILDGDCITISPEGTRSPTGQLSIFKKGPFHIWEQLNARIVPMIIFGAYELYPPGKQMTLPGHVHVRYLDPLDPNDSALQVSSVSEEKDNKSRRELASNELRKRMLKALGDMPKGVGKRLSSKERLINLIVLVAVFFWAYITYKMLESVVYKLNFTLLQATIWGAIVSIVITILLFIFALYAPSLKSMRRSMKSKPKSD